ncbi:TPA: hypothetical protein ACH3X2_013122 [Trebouxia sp. C0005]
MHLVGHGYSRVELLTSKGAEKTTVASAAECEVEADRLTAGHERKHNACRAELEVGSSYTYIRRTRSPQNMWGKAGAKTPLRHMQTLRPQKQAQGKQARDRRTEAALPGYLYVLDSPVWVSISRL